MSKLSIGRGRPGTIIPMLAVCVTAMFGFVALAIDLGMLTVARTECQSAVDAAALAGARVLNNKPTASNNDKATAESTALAATQNNTFINTNFTAGQVTTSTARVYTYNTSTQTFQLSSTQGSNSWSAMEVEVNVTQPTYFAKIFGVSSMPNNARAVAVHKPRDVAIILDFSGSMKNGTTFQWDADGYRSAGMLSNDPQYPKFGHYERYNNYATTYGTFSKTAGLVSSNYYSSTITSRPHPFQMGGRSDAGYYNTDGERSAIANLTVETPGGPPIVKDFYTLPAGQTTPSSTNMNLAFHHWTPSESGGDTYNYVAPTQSYASYNASTGLLPAPDTYRDQSEKDSTGVPIRSYDGDKFPRKKGKVMLIPTSWSPFTTTGSAINVADYLGWWDSGSLYTAAGALPVISIPAAASGRTWYNFRDATWERYGYDLDVDHYVTNRNNGGAWDPRWDWNTSTGAWAHNRSSDPPSANTYRPQLKAAADRFKGYSMGPGYWGKTFFIWPPDPRSANDWRQKFFLKADGTAFNTQADNNTAGGSARDSVSEVLLRSTVQTSLPGSPSWTNVNSNHVLNDSGYTINYNAVLAWIASGPQTLPANLRSGHILYYSAIPTTIPSTGLTDDQRFWREYIDFVLGNIANTAYRPSNNIAGTEPRGWPEGASPSIDATDLSAYDVDGAGTVAADLIPYANYTDNPLRPRGHFWFGPMTMMDFISSNNPGKNWNSGTMHESQCWQLKAAMQSSLDDIRNNHPNDNVGMCYFAHSNFNSVRVPMGQQWDRLKNSLFYPYSIINTTTGAVGSEVRPYNSSFGSSLVGNIPNANGGTDPNTGFCLAYNLLSTSGGGRRGATKLVVFETDGVPNSVMNWNPAPNFTTGVPAAMTSGYNSTFAYSSAGSFYSNGDSRSINGAYAIVQQIVKQAATTTSGDSGHSLPNTKARVYPIGFGDLFDTPSATFNATAKTFLGTLAYYGNTQSAIGDLDSSFIITGAYQRPDPTQPVSGTNPAGRIEKMRDAMERIMQGGVQVTLIE